jgi:hypothetical protein
MRSRMTALIAAFVIVLQVSFIQFTKSRLHSSSPTTQFPYSGCTDRFEEACRRCDAAGSSAAWSVSFSQSIGYDLPRLRGPRFQFDNR